VAIKKSDMYYKSGPKKGKLKPGYWFDTDGKPRYTKPKPKTAVYAEARKLGLRRAKKAGQKIRKTSTSSRKRSTSGQKRLFK